MADADIISLKKIKELPEITVFGSRYGRMKNGEKGG